jgi:ABC-2 type transport system ATP-binding protein
MAPAKLGSEAADSDGTGRGPAIEVHELTKVYGGRTAVDAVSFQVARGEVFGFLGPNGAGKTTTVRMLSTLITATAGAATVAGVPVAGVPVAGVPAGPAQADRLRARISVMPESPGLYKRLTVAENLDFFARLYGLPSRRERIGAALAAVRLTDRANDPCSRLSKGLRQRAALARALLNDPAVMFLDEPTSGLDPAAAHEVLTLIGTLRDRGVTVFLTTHRLDEAEQLCDRVAIMNTSLRRTGRPDELRREVFQRTLAVRTAKPLARPDEVFGGLPGVRNWRAAPGPPGYLLTVADPDRAAPGVIRALVTAGADVVSAGESRHTLEDVYLELAGDRGAGA